MNYIKLNIILILLLMKTLTLFGEIDESKALNTIHVFYDCLFTDKNEYPDLFDAMSIEYVSRLVDDKTIDRREKLKSVWSYIKKNRDTFVFIENNNDNPLKSVFLHISEGVRYRNGIKCDDYPSVRAILFIGGDKPVNKIIEFPLVVYDSSNDYYKIKLGGINVNGIILQPEFLDYDKLDLQNILNVDFSK